MVYIHLDFISGGLYSRVGAYFYISLYIGGWEWGTGPEKESQLLLPDTGTAPHCRQVRLVYTGTSRYSTGTVPTVPTYEDSVGTVPTRILLLQKVEVEEPIE